jgi:hypothetical protein
MRRGRVGIRILGRLHRRSFPHRRPLPLCSLVLPSPFPPFHPVPPIPPPVSLSPCLPLSSHPRVRDKARNLLYHTRDCNAVLQYYSRPRPDRFHSSLFGVRTPLIRSDLAQRGILRNLSGLVSPRGPMSDRQFDVYLDDVKSLSTAIAGQLADRIHPPPSPPWEGGGNACAFR